MPRDKGDTLDDDARLRHMLKAAEEAIGFAKGRTRQDLDTDRMLTRALVHCVQEIGEAGARVSDQTRERSSEVRWEKMVGMRHILVHEYFNIDEDVVWRTVRDELPKLRECLRTMLGM